MSVGDASTCLKARTRSVGELGCVQHGSVEPPSVNDRRPLLERSWPIESAAPYHQSINEEDNDRSDCGDQQTPQVEAGHSLSADESE
jgi:hypothetical protein